LRRVRGPRRRGRAAGIAAGVDGEGSGQLAASTAAGNRAVIGLHADSGGLESGLRAGIAKRVLNHFRQPATEGGNGHRGTGHGEEANLSSMEPRIPPANENLRGSSGALTSHQGSRFTPWLLRIGAIAIGTALEAKTLHAKRILR